MKPPNTRFVLRSLILLGLIAAAAGTPSPGAAPGPAIGAFSEAPDQGVPSAAELRSSDGSDIAVSGDSRGNLIGTVSKDGGKTGLAGETVTVGAGSWTQTATTGENGFFAVPLPLAVRGKIAVASAGAALTVDVSDLPLRLTARPERHRLPLEGPWSILIDPPAGWRTAAPQDQWKPIDVPSNWEMKGFRSQTGKAVMRRVFAVPSGWKGKRILLRADGIYSHCEAWLNGVRVGSHEGGATPVELDLTEAAQPGKANTLDVLITARSAAADIDHMSVYAYFEIAGIWRPIEVFAVEPAHVAAIHWAVSFDPSFKDADLAVEMRLVNSGDAAAAGRPLNVRLIDPEGRAVATQDSTVSLGAWEERTLPVPIHVAAAEPWTAERPRVYKLEARFNGETITSPVGFREVRVSGKRFTINGRAAKLFGVCLHSADPVAGRAVTPALVEKDLGLIKGANLNAVRTSHYPPHPHTPEFADTLGLYIEDEGPACWAETDDLRAVPLYMGIYAAFVERDRNHPSVVYWSMCNESNYTRIFQMTQHYIKGVDPTRPSSGTYAPESDKADVVVHHHPTNLDKFIRAQANVAKPVFMDECQSVFHGWGDLAVSLEVDPGMHDYWMTGVPDVIRACFETENQVGTMIWAWVDDAFQIPGRGIGYWRRDMTPIRYEDAVYAGAGHGYVGDCVWGVVDGWRRPRPEWEICRKVYSPVQIASEPLAPGPVRVPVFNQNVFEDLSIYTCRWAVAGKSGIVRADVPPRSNGFLTLPVEAKPDDVVELEFRDGVRLVAEFRLPFKPRAPEPWSMGAPADLAEEPKDRYLSGASVVTLRGDDAELAYDRVGGELMWGLGNKSQVLLKGPRLHVLKSESPGGTDPAGWKFTGETHGHGTIRWNGVFGDEWAGGYDIRLDREGNAEFDYEFTYRGPGLWVRELGLAFDLPLPFQKLEWERKAEYTVYPEDYIGRPRGTADARSAGLQLVPPGPRPIALDDHAWGTNDFRSAKRNIYRASLSGAWGKVTVVSDGTQTVRCALTPHEVSLKVLDFYGGSGGPKEWSVLGFHYGAGRFIKSGEVVRGKVRLRLR